MKNTNYSTDELMQIDKKNIWHPFTQMKKWISDEQLIISKGDGNYLIDSDNKRYIDGVSSLWTIVHGHNHPHINNAIKTQVDNLSHSTLLGLANDSSILFTEKLMQFLPDNLKRIFFSDSGSTGVEIALKIAFQYWQQKENPKPKKNKFIKLSNAYHGDTIGSVSVGGIDLFHRIFGSLTFETISIPNPSFYHSDFKSEEECIENTLNHCKKILDSKHEQICAIVLEAYLQGASGILTYPKGFMKRLYELCRQYDILIIFDEVHTGFGRTGKLFALEIDNLKPDILVLAKGITGGYLPLAVTCATEKIFEGFLGEPHEFKTFYHGHTYTGNPLACAAATANLEIFENEKTISKLPEKIERITHHLNELNSHPNVGNIRHLGMIVGIELVDDKVNRKPFDIKKMIGHKICMEIRKHGVILRPLGDVIVLMPPLSITIEEIDFIFDALNKSIKSVL